MTASYICVVDSRNTNVSSNGVSVNNLKNLKVGLGDLIRIDGCSNTNECSTTRNVEVISVRNTNVNYDRVRIGNSLYWELEGRCLSVNCRELTVNCLRRTCSTNVNCNGVSCCSSNCQSSVVCRVRRTITSSCSWICVVGQITVHGTLEDQTFSEKFDRCANIKLVNTDVHCDVTSVLVICCITNVEVYNWRRSNVNCESVCTNRVDWEVDAICGVSCSWICLVSSTTVHLTSKCHGVSVKADGVTDRQTVRSNGDNQITTGCGVNSVCWS